MPRILPPIQLHARALGRLFGDTVAIRNVALEARSGELVVVHGPNGCGKSTLLRLLAGVLEPTVGTIEWRLGDRPARPRIALLAHATHLVDALTVRENLELARRLARQPASMTDHVLAGLALMEVSGRPAGTLSAGTRRRAALARALVTDPDVLLVDEPFAALDRTAATVVRSALQQATREGRLVVIATHDPAASGLTGAHTVALFREPQPLLVALASA